MQEIEGFDEPDQDSDYDYEDTYAKKRKRRSGKSSRGAVDTPMKRGLKVRISTWTQKLMHTCIAKSGFNILVLDNAIG